MKWIFVLAIALAGTAHAQSIYKCRDAKGSVVYQSDPCANAEKRWDASPGQLRGSHSDDSRMTRAEAEARIEQDRRALQRSNRQASSLATAVQVRIGGPTCAPMKEARDRARDRANTRWTYEMASQWDARVRAACK